MTVGDRVQTPRGPGTLVFIGGKTDGLPSSYYPEWVPQQMAVVAIEGRNYLFVADEIVLDATCGDL